LRRSVPGLSGGSACDYLAVESTSDRVFAPLRRLGDTWALPVLSFSDEPVKTILSLAALRLDPDASYTFTEAFSAVKRAGKGKEMTRFEVTLPPYAVQVWTAKRVRR